MTYDQLVTLEAIINCGSFKAAAEFLNKSQPALSVAIKKLEEQFQVQLFNRDGYRPVLTAEGKLFYEKARMALMHMKSLELFGQELGMEQEKEIKVGLDALSPLSLILCNLKSFFDQYQSTNLTLDLDNVHGTVEKIIAGELDMGFTPVHDNWENIESICVHETQMIPVCSPGMYETFGSSFALLKGQPQIIVRDTGKGSDRSFGVFEDARKWFVNDMGSKKEIILEGLGWGRLPDFMIQEELKQNKLVVADVQGLEALSVKVHMIRNTARPHGPLARKLWDEISTSLLESS